MKSIRHQRTPEQPKLRSPANGTAPKTPRSYFAWGRHAKASTWDAVYAASVMFFCPVLVIVAFMAIHHFDGSLVEMSSSLISSQHDSGDPLLIWISQHAPRPSWQGFAIYGCWLTFQALLYLALPGKHAKGQVTPAGHLLEYRVNGLLAWIVSVSLYVLGAFLGFYRLSAVARQWGPLLVAANVYGYVLTGFAYVKAHYFPTHPRDNKYSGSRLYDIYMGVEFNPRISNAFDFKLFHNGRPGIIAWSIINISFAAFQYEKHQTVTLGMVGVNILQLVYVVDFFLNEDWYLRTIDIAHDHFGFYLAWGDSVWLPQMYTLQGQYLSYQPESQASALTIAVFVFGLAGYCLFRSANHQKDLIRKTGGDCLIWGEKPKVIHAEYFSTDGIKHSSILLCSGWWGLVRHANYLGDLIQAFAMCSVCGYTHLIPFTYLVFMSILLLHRSSRDNSRCLDKYGKFWDQYRDQVKWVLIPAVF